MLLVALGVALRQVWPDTRTSAATRRRRPRQLDEPTAWTSFTASASATLPPPSRPNIVICLLDDAGAGDAGALGHPLLQTPNIDAFAARAVAFSQAYSGAPNCSPSRASLLTGRAPYRTGVYDFLSKQSGAMHLHRRERTIANLLRDSGYATAHYGKWHLSRGKFGYTPWRFGFEHSNGSYLAASALLRAFVGWVSLGRTSQDQPFFAYIALWEPHEPVHRWSPRRTQSLYTSRVLARAAAEDAAVPVGKKGKKLRRPPPPASLEELAPNVASGGGGCVWRLPRRNPPRVYYGAMSQVDESFGTMVRELDRIGQRDNTIVVLTSDNGPEHRELNSWGSSGGLRGAKGYIYEGGIRIPMLVQWPAGIRAAPFVLHEPVHQWDLLPTLCAAAGIAPPTDRTIDGVSLLGLLLSGGETADVGVGTAASMAATSREPQKDAARDPAALAASAERRGEHVQLRGYTDAFPQQPPLTLGAAQALPLPRVAGGADDVMPSTGLVRATPMFWAMHRGRGGMQYAIRVGAWKLLGGYGTMANRGDGPLGGGEVVPWLRTSATLGRVELYLLTHDPSERIDLSAAHPHVVALLLPELVRLVRETATDGPDVPGWRQRSPPCPRFIRDLNVTEWCCQPLPATVDADEEVLGRPSSRSPQSVLWRDMRDATELEAGEDV